MHTIAGSFVYQPALSADAKRIFTPVGKDLVVYSVRTGQVMGWFQGHSDIVTGVCVAPWDKQRVLSWGLDGCLNEWNIADGSIAKTYSLKAPIHELRFDNKTVYALVGENRDCVQFTLENAQPEQTVIFKGPCHNLNISRSGKYVLSLAGEELCVWQKDYEKKHSFKCKATPTKLCVASDDSYVAVGDTTGCITSWYVLDSIALQSTGKIHQARHHWHSEEIRSMAMCGPQLLSGAAKGVVAQWNFEAVTRSKIEGFSAPIEHIAVSMDGRWMVTTLADNSMQMYDIFSSCFGRRIEAVDRSFEGFVEPSLVPVPQRCRGTLQKTVAINAGGQRVQFFNDRTQVNAVRVSERNYIPNADNTSYWVLKSMTFSPDAKFMATIETRKTNVEFVADQAMLKFWKWDEEKDTFLNESFSYNAHRKFFSIVAHPTSKNTFFTASEDGMFKAWSRDEQKGWNCVAVGSWREKACHAVQVSPDGSLMAVGHDGAVSIWEPITHREIQVLHGFTGKVVQIEFIVVEDRLCMVVRTEKQIRFIDLATLEETELEGNNSRKMRLGSSSTLAISTNSSITVYKFALEGEKIVAKSILSEKPDFPIADVALVQTPGGEVEGSEVVFLTPDSWLYRLGEKSADIEPAVEETKRITAYQKAFVADQAEDVGGIPQPIELVKRDWAAAADGPHPHVLAKVLPATGSHMCPPPGVVYRSLMRNFCKPLVEDTEEVITQLAHYSKQIRKQEVSRCIDEDILDDKDLLALSQSISSM